MRKSILPFEAKDDETRLDVSSMIDVCFLVLIYFLVAMTIVPAERDLPVGLPEKNKLAETQSPIQPILLRIDGDGAVFSGFDRSEQILDADPNDRDLPLLSTQLAQYSDAASNAGEVPMVKLRVDDEANQQRVIDVLNALAAFKVTTVAFEDFGQL